jgi:hypothetical protein
MDKTMRALKRRYVYKETFDTIILWAKNNNIKSPNRKNNFPYYLEKYLEMRK